MSELSGGQNFYAEMPNSYNMVVNTAHPLIEGIIEDKQKKTGEKLTKINSKIDPLKADTEKMQKEQSEKKEEEVKQEEKDQLEELNKKLAKLGEDKTKILHKYSEDNKIVKQVIDLALLSNNMLKGEDLIKFVRRSVDLIGK